MRYSRLLEENSFSNRRADYVWLLALCASFLLVRPHIHPFTQSNALGSGHITASDLTIPLIIIGLFISLHLVTAESFRQNVSFRRHHVGPTFHQTCRLGATGAGG